MLGLVADVDVGQAFDESRAIGVGEEHDRFGLVADAIDGQERLILGDHGDHVLARDGDVPVVDEGEAAPIECGIALDGDDAAGGDGRAHGGAVEHAVECEVVDVAGGPGDLLDALGARNVVPNRAIAKRLPRFLFGMGRHSTLPTQSCTVLACVSACSAARRPAARPPTGPPRVAWARSSRAAASAWCTGAATSGSWGSSPTPCSPTVARSTGVIPRALVDRELAHARLSELVVVDTMHERKQRMHDLSDGFIALPGGFGTLDELFEALTWAQLGMHGKPCGLLDVDGFWEPLRALVERQVAEEFVRPHHAMMLVHNNDPAALLDAFAAYRAPDVSKWIGRRDV